MLIKKKLFMFYLIISLLLIFSVISIFAIPPEICASEIEAGSITDQNQEVVIKDFNTDEYPQIYAYINFKEASTLSSADLDKENFKIFENNDPVKEYGIERVAKTNEPIAVVLVLDTSGSMEGQPISDSVNAAAIFMNDMKSIDKFSIVGFSDLVTVYSSFTSNRQKLAESIKGIQSGGETALFDGIIIGLEQFSSLRGIKHKYLIVLSDGMDTVSKSGMNDAIAKAINDNVIVYSIALISKDFNPEALSNISKETKGDLLITTDSRDLSGLYREISRKIKNRYKISYTSLWPNTENINVRISIEKSGSSEFAETSYKNPFYVDSPDKIVKIPKKPDFLAFFDTLWVRIVLYIVVFIGVTLFLYIIASMIIPSEHMLRKRTDFYGYYNTSDNYNENVQKKKGFLSKILSFVSRAASKRGFGELFETRMRKAGINMKGSEFIFLHLSSVIVISLGSYLATKNLSLTFLLVLFIIFAPFLLLNLKTSQRLKKFNEQLTDTLQLVEGALKAGYSFNQALAMVVEETKPPISDEFKMVLSEIRMGLPEKEALENMSKRLTSDLFTWTVMAVNVQRDVGGNLAEVMDIIVNTIRERDRVLRQIRALTSEGKLSAYILIGLPIILAVVLVALNRTYISLLWTTKIGLVVLVMAAIMMIVGIVWIMKIIKIDY